MENKVYYGEYSLDYWIELILSKNIILPDYQRNFSWDETKREKLITSLKNKEFVPPVIIGSFTKNGLKENILIDGQQRLTSILLSVLGFFPDRETYKKHSKDKVRKYIDENDDFAGETDSSTDVINWTFNDLLIEDNLTISKIKSTLEKDEYFKALNNDNEIDNSFLKNTFLGFSYLVPSNSQRGDQQRYYSSVFRNINRQGMSLTGQESREALYYLDESKTSFFKPKFINLIEGELSIDFIRYLSILSQYKKEGSVQNLCSGFGGRKEKLEEYYENYINFIIGDKNIKYYISYEELFNTNEQLLSCEQPHSGRYSKMSNFISDSPLSKKTFDSIIDCDLYYFGLIYLIIFENKNIDLEKWSDITKKIEKSIEEFKAPYLDKQGVPTYELSKAVSRSFHQKNPSALKYLRERVEKSIAIYREFEI
ncbi:DUF262 domain-containing protein [Streptococcus oralis]|jgi:hypothetical protein|uniref:PF03235 family protein n=1 Tax=Streptococcus oralis SK304 TaxID=1161421 RepID=J4K8C1_STROR|nr:DUF262 domain-containing protein [Streptococcus oralis]EJP20761.1 PF03235 family protein [Streptococcus oralis SK304]MCY7092204.1 DUF262 domain-containing protein [Streptococcus oralis]